MLTITKLENIQISTLIVLHAIAFLLANAIIKLSGPMNFYLLLPLSGGVLHMSCTIGINAKTGF